MRFDSLKVIYIIIIIKIIPIIKNIFEVPSELLIFVSSVFKVSFVFNELVEVVFPLKTFAVVLEISQ